MPDWINDNIPASKKFGDTYYSIHDGQAETAHVYINGNNLPSRWPSCKKFVIAELGFGTGLNFLETYRQWQQMRMADSQLQFISFEQFPLGTPDMKKALSQWPILANSIQRLLDNWDTGGNQNIIRFGDDCELKVIFGDANERLPTQDFLADAWYLDGFSPSKNPELWNAELMRAVFEKTAPSGTFATYSVAGMVRRNLQNTGFEIERAAGFATKREMLKGYRPAM